MRTTSTSTLIAAALLLANTASAVVVHTTVNQTVASCDQWGSYQEDSIAIDLNGDATVDFYLNYACGSNEFGENVQSRTLRPDVSGNELLKESGSDDLELLQVNDPMGTLWSTSSGRVCFVGESLDGSFTYGNFCQTSGYIGVAFKIGGSTHYGWIQVDLSSDFITVVDMAYEDVAGEPILAGQTTGGAVGIADAVSVNISVYPNPSNGIIAVELPSVLTNGMLEVYDLQGALVMSKPINTTREELNIGTAGSYVLRIRSNEYSVQERVIIQ